MLQNKYPHNDLRTNRSNKYFPAFSQGHLETAFKKYLKKVGAKSEDELSQNQKLELI